MKILKLPSYYYPEQISSSHLSHDLEEAYHDAGFEMVVYAPTPCRGITPDVRKEYKRKIYEERLDGTVKVHRFPMLREHKNSVLRALRYILIEMKQYHFAVREHGVDVLSSGSTPPTAGILMARVKKKLTKKYGHPVSFIYSLQDVFPDSLVYTGLAKKDSLLYRIGDRIANYTYQNADKIIVISDDIKRLLLDKGVPAEKLELIRNWIDCRAVKPVEKRQNSLYDEYRLSKDGFYVIYAGNLGKAQGVDVIIRAAELLSGLHEIEFIIFGNGVEADTLQKSAEGMKNIRFLPFQPQEKVAEVYSLGDICLITCKAGTGAGAFPSKAVSIMAAGSPIIASFDADSELSRVLGESGCGMSTEPGNARELAMAIEKMYQNERYRTLCAERARTIALNEFSRETCTGEYVKLLRSLSVGKD